MQRKGRDGGGRKEEAEDEEEGGDRDEAPLFLLSFSLPRGDGVGRPALAVVAACPAKCPAQAVTGQPAQQRPKLPPFLWLGASGLSYFRCRLSSLSFLPVVWLLRAEVR